MKQILLIGGTFDPIHNGHLNLASEVCKNLHFDEVWFVIAKKPRWKSNITSTRHRLTMLRTALLSYPQFYVCELELRRDSEKISYTYDTVQELLTSYPDVRFYFLIGSDQLEQLHRWYRIDELANDVQFILAHREGYQIHENNFLTYKLIDSNVVGKNVSSTWIRQGFSREAPKPVLDYIDRKGIYLDTQIKSILSPRRYEHSKSVAKLAKKIAQANHVDVDQAYIAAILHDCAKELSYSQSLELMQTYYPKLTSVSKNLYHQYLGAHLAKTNYHIEDPEILHAIMYHATGSIEMSKLDKIIYAADKIEPTRDYDSTALIKSCMDNIDVGFCNVLGDTINYLRSIQVPVHAETLEAYQTHCNKEANK